MPTTVFGVTSSEVAQRVNPANNPYLFSVGNGPTDSMTVAAVEQVAQEAEDHVLGMIPEKYRRLVSAVEGERVVREAIAGQTVFALGLAPVVAGTLRMWRNLGGYYPRRRVADALASDAYTVTLATGVVTLVEGLREGDTIHADYAHTAAQSAAAGFGTLRSIVAKKAAVEIARRFNFFEAPDAAVRFEQWADECRKTLIDYHYGRIGVQGIDRLVLVDPTRAVGPREFWGGPAIV